MATKRKNFDIVEQGLSADQLKALELNALRGSGYCPPDVYALGGYLDGLGPGCPTDHAGEGGGGPSDRPYVYGEGICLGDWSRINEIMANQ